MKYLKYAWVVLTGLATLLLYSLLIKKDVRKHVQSRSIRTELAAVDAEARAQRAEAELGAERARQRVEEEYRTTVDALDVSQRKQAEELRSPGKLASFLVRAGKR